jgi:hypothetical protein
MKKLRNLPEEDDEPIKKPKIKKPRDLANESAQLWFLSFAGIVAGGVMMFVWPVIGAFVLVGGVAGFLWFTFGLRPKA